ncbi:hypothetical protein BDR26DRAFT_868155 [Obelidium mucronatum]|nr:hypothetical protein BDR26DRAFT_868155 [Obelidium mucronatum]
MAQAAYYTAYFTDPICNTTATRISYDYNNTSSCNLPTTAASPPSPCLPSPQFPNWFIRTGCLSPSNNASSIGNTLLGSKTQIYQHQEGPCGGGSKGLSQSQSFQYRFDECVPNLEGRTLPSEANSSYVYQYEMVTYPVLSSTGLSITYFNWALFDHAGDCNTLAPPPPLQSPSPMPIAIHTGRSLETECIPKPCSKETPFIRTCQNKEFFYKSLGSDYPGNLSPHSVVSFADLYVDSCTTVAKSQASLLSVVLDTCVPSRTGKGVGSLIASLNGTDNVSTWLYSAPNCSGASLGVVTYGRKSSILDTECKPYPRADIFIASIPAATASIGFVKVAGIVFGLFVVVAGGWWVVRKRYLARQPPPAFEDSRYDLEVRVPPPAALPDDPLPEYQAEVINVEPTEESTLASDDATVETAARPAVSA